MFGAYIFQIFYLKNVFLAEKKLRETREGVIQVTETYFYIEMREIVFF